MNNNSFAKNFLWGTATAAHQVEGNNSNTDFWEWEKKHKLVPDSDEACDHYKLYKEDIKLIKNLNNNAHRLSIEWARIEPEEGKFSEKEINHYKEVLKELKKNNIKVFVTLHHFTNPTWFSKKGGWEKKENVKYFERYAKFCVEELKNLSNNWVIINEPNVYIALAYLKGFFPPQKRNLLLALKVYLNFARAHRILYKSIHNIQKNAEVGSAIAMVYFKANSIIEKVFLPTIKFITNFSFLSLTRDCHDYLGINHYFLYILDYRDLKLIKKIKPKDYSKIVKREVTDFGWLVYPQGIYEVVTNAWKRYKIPIIITENGIADRKDVLRPAYIKNYLTWLKQAIVDGANVIGYFHWSLLDNIEWGQGTEIRFGLYETDFRTQKRIPRRSAAIYSEIAKSNGANL